MANKTGIVSISFRKHTKEEILAAAKEAELQLVEWGGDIHVPHGDLSEAERAAKITRKMGLDCAEYGSYYIIGQSEKELFNSVLKSAKALGTDIIRVWPGMNRSSDSINDEEYRNYVLDAQRICDMDKSITIALECHPNSLTDEYHTALKFISDVNRENLKMMWQPNQYRPFEYNIDSINALFDYIVAVHVFSWSRKTRLPLSAKENDWKNYISLLSKKELNYMLEFMHDDNLSTLKETASVLNSWLKHA